MLLFRSEEHAANWCRLRSVELGAVLNLETLWELSKAWYGDRLRPDWRRRTRDEMHELFASLGLAEPFWRFD